MCKRDDDKEAEGGRRGGYLMKLFLGVVAGVH